MKSAHSPTKKAPVSIQSLAALAGMVGSAFFVILFTIEGMVRVGYDPLSMYVSELSLGPDGWIQILNFYLLGILLVIFAWGVAKQFPAGRASRAGPILLVIMGISIFLAGLFTMDPVQTLAQNRTLDGKLHTLFSSILFLLAPISCYVFYRRFKTDPEWKSFAKLTLVVGTIVALAVILLQAGPTTFPDPPNAFNPWVGLIQRVGIIAYLAWIYAFAQRLYRGTSK